MIRIQLNQQDLRRFNLDMMKRKDMQKVLRRIMSEVTDKAKANCPVRTGQLKRSWGHAVESDNMIMNGFTEEYASYVEYGTERMRPRFFLRKAVEGTKKEIPSIIQNELNL